MNKIFNEITEEIKSQDAKWGEQNHPSLDQTLLNRISGCTEKRMAEEYEIPNQERAKILCNIHAKRKTLTFAHIAVEELSEAICTFNESEMRKELVQLAAVIVQWVQTIDRRSKK